MIRRKGSERERERARQNSDGVASTRARKTSFFVGSQCSIATCNNDVNQSSEGFLTGICPFVSQTELHRMIETVDDGLNEEKQQHR